MNKVFGKEVFNDVAVPYWLVRVHLSIVARIGRDLPIFLFSFFS